MLKVLFSSNDLEGCKTGVFNNKPEERKRLVKEKLGTNKHFEFLEVKTKYFFCVEVILVRWPYLNREKDLSLARIVHDDEMIDFLENAWVEWFDMFKSAECKAHLLPFGVPDDDELAGGLNKGFFLL